MKKNVLLFIMLIAGIPTFAQTILPATLSCGQKLTLAGSPYIANTNVTVTAGCSLTVDPGVEIKMANNTSIFVFGKLDFLGTAAQPIWIHALDTAWRLIYLNNADKKSIFNYTIFEDARHGLNGEKQNLASDIAAVSALYSSFEVNNCTFKHNRRSLYGFHGDNFIIKNCFFDSTNVGEKILMQYADNSEVSGNILLYTGGLGDAIDFDASNNVIIKDNYVYGGDADALDIGERDSIGCDGIEVTNNFFFDMGDKGISCGEHCKNLNLHHNVIVRADVGIGSKAGSIAVADHNTLFGNRIGIKSYDHLDGWGPGNLTVTNSIIAASIDSTWYKAPTATLNVSYSLSDIDLIPGTSNVQGDPKFIDTSFAVRDFHLTTGSPAIDNGNPAFALDPDGSRSDIGRFDFNANATGLTNKNLDNGFLYPNPSQGKFTINLGSNYESGKLILQNSLGQVVLTKEISSGKTEYTLDLSGQPQGIYYLRLPAEKEFSTKKLIKY